MYDLSQVSTAASQSGCSGRWYWSSNCLLWCSQSVDSVASETDSTIVQRVRWWISISHYSMCESLGLISDAYTQYYLQIRVQTPHLCWSPAFSSVQLCGWYVWFWGKCLTNHWLVFPWNTHVTFKMNCDNFKRPLGFSSSTIIRSKKADTWRMVFPSASAVLCVKFYHMGYILNRVCLLVGLSAG